MITKFRIFESNEDEPEVGDYVICYEDGPVRDTRINTFLLDNIGQIIEIDNEDEQEKWKFLVQFENFSDTYVKAHYFNDYNKDGCRKMSKDDIKFWNSDRNMLEAIIIAKKYNL